MRALWAAAGCLSLGLVACSASTGDRSDARKLSQSDTSGCTATAAGQGFTSSAFTTQTGHFVAELDATPSVNDIDAVVGLSAAPATGFTGLATIVRFAATGAIDVRNGGTYAADVNVPYTAGASYHVKLDVDVASHTYSVWVTPPGGAAIQLASGYAFRTEQQSATSLSDVDEEVDGGSGAVSVCGFVVEPASPPPPPPDCARAAAGQGFVDAAFASETGSFIASFDATPSAANIDAVVGLSAATATRFTDLAAIVRFNDAGFIDARNGSTYAAATSYPYTPGTKYTVTMSVNVKTHTYSVNIMAPGATYPTMIASHYAFRSEQASVTQLASGAIEVDAASGTLSLCNFATPTGPGYTLFSEPTSGGNGYGYVATTPSGHFVVSRVDTPTGEYDGSGNVVRVASFGGRPGVDAAGNLYLATTSTLDKYDASWTRVWSVPLAGVPVGFAVDAGGDAVVASSGTVTKYAPNGAAAWSVSLPVADAAIDRGGNVYALANDAGAIVVEKLTAAGDIAWRNAYAGDGTQNAISLACDPDGDVFFAGKWRGTIDFGGGPRTYLGQGEAPSSQAVVVGLATNGGFLYQASHDRYFLSGFAADAAGDVLIAGQGFDTPVLGEVAKFTRGGVQTWQANADGDQTEPGLVSGLAADASGNVLVSSHTSQTGTPWLVKIAP